VLPGDLVTVENSLVVSDWHPSDGAPVLPRLRGAPAILNTISVWDVDVQRACTVVALDRGYALIAFGIDLVGWIRCWRLRSTS